jgi:hypothetical protein
VHSDAELDALNDDKTPHIAALGGEGSGKTTWLVIKTLERLRRGCSGIMGSPDLPHFGKSLWTEFQNWCPWHHVVATQRYRSRPEWEPSHAFTLNFINGTELMCGGFKDPMSWEGGNVNFAAYDEVRRQPDATMMKVLAGRVRITGPNGEPPQQFYSSTPRMSWMFDFFGPLVKDDPQAVFKSMLKTLTLDTRDNESNLSDGYVATRGASLTGSEQLVLLGGGWANTDDDDTFLPTIEWWDVTKEDMPSATMQEPLIVACDAATDHDSFGMIAIGKHPRDNGRLAVRFVREWKPPAHGPIEFGTPGPTVGDWPDTPAWEFDRLTKNYNVLIFTYDPYQLHSFSREVRAYYDVYVKPFNQSSDRLEADKALRDMIMERRIAHDGDTALRTHLKNANRSRDSVNKKMRLVKRTEAMKIDLAVCLSMGAHQTVKELF